MRSRNDRPAIRSIPDQEGIEMPKATKKNTKSTKKASASKERVKRWSDVTGEIRIFGEKVEFGKGKKKDSFIRYSTSLGVKNDDGEYSNFYYKVGFAKDVDPERTDESGFVIRITRGFLTFDEFVDKKTGEVKRVPKLVILDYEDPEDGDEEEVDEEAADE